MLLFLLEPPHRGDSNEYTQYTISQYKRKITLIYPKSAAMRFFQGTQERVRNIRGKRAISVRAIKVLLHFVGLTRLAQQHLLPTVTIPARVTIGTALLVYLIENNNRTCVSMVVHDFCTKGEPFSRYSAALAHTDERLYNLCAQTHTLIAFLADTKKLKCIQDKTYSNMTLTFFPLSL